MSYGKMNSFITIFEEVSIRDAEGFVTKKDLLLTSMRAYKESRRGSVSSKRDSLTVDSAVFRFRKPKSINIVTDLIIECKGERFKIVSVEDIEERGMYLEVLTKKVTGAGE